jgi:hypothetical protein
MVRMSGEIGYVLLCWTTWYKLLVEKSERWRPTKELVEGKSHASY